MMHAFWVVLALLGLGSIAHADDARPAYLEIREIRAGLYDVTWKTPMRGGSRLRMAPRFPAGTAAVPGTYSARVLSDALIERWQLESADSLAGRELGIDGLELSARDVIVRIRFADGRDVHSLLRGARPVFVVPAPPDAGLLELPARLRAGVIRGMLHTLREPLHVVFAIALGMLGGLSLFGAALGVFLIAQLAGVACGMFIDVAFVPPPLGAAFVGIAAAVSARIAMARPRPHVAALAAIAGALHGLSMTPDNGVWEGLGACLGIDSVHLLVAGIVALTISRPRRLRVPALYAVGVTAIAMTFVTVSARADVRPAPAPGNLPTLTSAGAADDALAATQPVRGLETPAAAYLDVGPFETRLEILARLSFLDAWLALGAPSTGELALTAQETLLARAGAALVDRIELRVDGQRRSLETTGLRGFTATDATGIYFRDEAVVENAENATVGFVFALGTHSTPREISLEWSDLHAAAAEVPVRTTDPETTRDAVVTAISPTLIWRNELVEDPAPSVEAVAVRSPVLAVPIWTLILGVAALGALGLARLRTGAITSRLLLTSACLAAPAWTVPFSSSWLRPAVPGSAEAAVIAAGLLQNVYRAFDYRDEQAVYERLAVSVTGDVLTDVYLEHRRALEVEKAGGARARVEAVEVTRAEAIEASSGGGFVGEFEWTVAGSVTHFGHRHVRQNRYRATITVGPERDRWRIHHLELLDEVRLR